MFKFKDGQERKPIDRAGLVSIHVRMFGASCERMVKDEIEANIKRFGLCECSDACKEPLNGNVEFDHKYPISLARKGDAIHWRALLPEHHQVKSSNRDAPHIAKTKRLAKKYNPEYRVDQAEIHKPKKMQSRPFDKRYRKKMNGEVERVNP